MKNRKKLPDMTEDTFWRHRSTASSTECTGLTPSAVLNEEESTAYGELYAIHPPKTPRP